MPNALNLSSFKPESLRGRAGFFRVGQTGGGQWWLLDPHDRPFFAKAVAAVNSHGRAGPPPEHRGAYARAVEHAHGHDGGAGFARGAMRRLRSWSVNTLGPWAEPALASAGLYATAVADFRTAGVPVIHRQGMHLPDVFDPGWSDACDRRAAEAAAPWAGQTDLIGYYTDDSAGWGEGRADRPSLLQVCLSLEPGFSAYHAAWEFVLAPHGGDIATLARAWRLDMPNKEVIRQRTLAERPLTTAGYVHDDLRFTREFARRYFTTTAAALRRHDPDHLVLGCRFSQPPGAAVLAECVYPHVDVVSWHCHGSDFDAQAAIYAEGKPTPLWLTAFGLSNERFRTASFKPHSGPTRLERMLRDGRRALTAACKHPAVVGYEWARWADEADEVPPFGAGLVHVDDREAVEHTELFAQINARAERLRARAAKT
jgi:agarase